MNFTINQTKSSQEIVNSALLSKLYNLFITNGNSHTINLLGNLYSSTGYKSLIDSLTQTYPDLIITVPLEGLYILFEDPNVEAVLQANNIGDGVGITILSASNAILTSSMFQNNTDITSFPEFIYFTKANGQNQPQSLFSGCSNLTYIDLSNVTYLNNSCFNGCSSLSINNQDIANVTVIGNDCFKGSNISGDMTFSHLTSIGSSAFRNTRIQSIDFTGSTFASVPNLCFDGCSSLSKIILPTTVTYLNENWCRNIASSPYIEGLDNVTSHSNNNWNLYNKTILNPIKIGLLTGGSFIGISGNNKTTSIPMYYEPLRTETSVGKYITGYFYYQSLFLYGSSSSHVNIGLLYYKNITSFGHCTFAGCNITNLVINNNTPPVFVSNTDNNQVNLDYYSNWSDTPFGHLGSEAAATIGTLWVPDSAVATYQADPLYSGLTIKGINTKTNGTDYDLPRYATYADWKTAEAAAVAQGGHAPQGLIEAWM